VPTPFTVKLTQIELVVLQAQFHPSSFDLPSFIIPSNTICRVSANILDPILKPLPDASDHSAKANIILNTEAVLSIFDEHLGNVVHTASYRM